MRCSSWRPTGRATHPVSCPWVIPTLRTAPARCRPGASRPSGAAAPKTTVDTPCSPTSAAAVRAVRGVGRSIPVGIRTTG